MVSSGTDPSLTPSVLRKLELKTRVKNGTWSVVVQLFTNASSPPAQDAGSVFSAPRSRQPWRWQWVWMKWCVPTVLWLIPRRPPLGSAAWTSRWLKFSLQPKPAQRCLIIYNHKPEQTCLSLADRLNYTFLFCILCTTSTFCSVNKITVKNNQFSRCSLEMLTVLVMSNHK